MAQSMTPGEAAPGRSNSNPRSSKPSDTSGKTAKGSAAATGQGALSQASVVAIAKNSVQGEHMSLQIDECEEPWHTMHDATAVVSALASSVSTGLTPLEAKRRLDAVGPNKLTPPQK